MRIVRDLLVKKGMWSLGEMSEYQVKGKEGINVERPEDKEGEKFNVIVVEGLKMKTGGKKKSKGFEGMFLLHE